MSEQHCHVIFKRFLSEKIYFGKIYIKFSLKWAQMNLGLSYFRVSNFTIEHKLLALPCQLPLLGVLIVALLGPFNEKSVSKVNHPIRLYTPKTLKVCQVAGGVTHCYCLFPCWLPLPMLTGPARSSRCGSLGTHPIEALWAKRTNALKVHMAKAPKVRRETWWSCIWKNYL